MDADTDDARVFAMNRPKPSILERIGTKPPAATAAAPAAAQAAQAMPADSDALPRPGDAYQAHSRAANKMQAMLCLIGMPPVQTCLAYSDLRWVGLLPPDKPGGGLTLLLRFIGVADVRIEGRNLDELVEPLRRHCLMWLRLQLPTRLPQGGDDGAVVITGMSVKPVER